MPQAVLLGGLSLDSELAALIAAAPLQSIGVGAIDRATSQRTEEWLRVHAECPQACRAALWLLSGDLDRSHTLSQDIATPEGSYWHGIMHRREGDYGNSKYWMRRVGNHPVTGELTRLFPEYEDPFHFIDLCERGARKQHSESEKLAEMQWAEWQLLFAHCYSEQ
jgi:hypothetical protein